jgi:hypothetical protein
MKNVCGDYVLHPPVSSNLPGNPPANEYINVPPNELKGMILREHDMEKKKKMISALKQWERIYTYPGYPWKSRRKLAVVTRYLKLSEQVNPAINLPYYQDTETDQGFEEIVDSLRGLYDNDNEVRENYSRQGERPKRDQEFSDGDFLTPTEPPMGQSVKERGDGPDPEGLDYNDPPTGGDIDGL